MEKNEDVPLHHVGGGTGKRFNKNKFFLKNFDSTYKITVTLSESQQFCNISFKSHDGVSSASIGG